MTTQNNPSLALEQETNEDLTDEQYAEELGSLVFQSTLVQYLALVEEAEVAEFENYVAENSEATNFVTDLCLRYPAFEELLMKELAALSDELQSVLPGNENI